MSLGIRHVAAAACLTVLVGCGSSLEPDEPGGADAAPTAGDRGAAAGGGPGGRRSAGGAADGGTGGTGGDTGRDRSGDDQDGDEGPQRNADGSPLEVTGEQLCGDLPADAASEALGVDVQDATPGDAATPQCTYSYVNGDGDDSTFTLAAMRPADVGGRTGLDAFDYMVDLSRGLAGPVDLDEEDLAVGDKAVRITGGDVHTGVLAAGGHLLTVTVPERDAGAAAVDALVGVVARALA